MLPGPQVDGAVALNGHGIRPEATWELEQRTKMSDNACLFCDEVDMWATIGVAMGWAPQWRPQ
jgi:hypothetical protein